MIRKNNKLMEMKPDTKEWKETSTIRKNYNGIHRMRTGQTL